MRRVRRNALVPFSPEKMFELVADVDRYPEFLPWCRRAWVSSRDSNEMLASIELAQAGFAEVFTTRNALSEPGSMSLELVDGPFEKLEGEWTFDPVGEEGCRVNLDIQFQFSSRVTERLLGPIFEAICNKLVDAFVQRARHLYG